MLALKALIISLNLATVFCQLDISLEFFTEKLLKKSSQAAITAIIIGMVAIMETFFFFSGGQFRISSKNFAIVRYYFAEESIMSSTFPPIRSFFLQTNFSWGSVFFSNAFCASAGLL